MLGGWCRRWWRNEKEVGEEEGDGGLFGILDAAKYMMVDLLANRIEFALSFILVPDTHTNPFNEKQIHAFFIITEMPEGILTVIPVHRMARKIIE